MWKAVNDMSLSAITQCQVAASSVRTLVSEDRETTTMSTRLADWVILLELIVSKMLSNDKGIETCCVQTVLEPINKLAIKII